MARTTTYSFSESAASVYGDDAASGERKPGGAETSAEDDAWLKVVNDARTFKPRPQTSTARSRYEEAEREAIRKIDSMRIFEEDTPYVEGYKGTMYLTRRELREAVLIMREFPHLDKRDGDNLLKLPERMWREKRRGGRSQRERRERRVQRECHERRVACRRVPREQQARKPRLGPEPGSAAEPAPDPTDGEDWAQRLREGLERRDSGLPDPFEDVELLPNGSDGASDNAPAPAPAPPPPHPYKTRYQERIRAEEAHPQRALYQERMRGEHPVTYPVTSFTCYSCRLIVVAGCGAQGTVQVCPHCQTRQRVPAQ